MKKINPFILHNHYVRPGDHGLIKLQVGKLPSGTMISIHAHVYHSYKPGPAVMILGGLHGDEINGIEIVRRAIFDKIFDEILCGTIIAVPLVNVHGFIKLSRNISEGKDVNRSFPGSLKGSIASKVARTITKYILPLVNFGLDFHSGAANRYNFPQVRYSNLDPRAIQLAQDFGPPFIIHKELIPDSLRKTAYEKNIPILVYEGGEALRLDGLSIDQGLIGLRRVLASQGILPEAPPINHSIINIKKAVWMRAKKAGLFMWTKQSGDLVQVGDALGFYHDRDGLEQIVINATRSGYIIAHNNNPVVNQGDAIFHIGYEYEVLPAVNRQGNYFP